MKKLIATGALATIILAASLVLIVDDKDCGMETVNVPCIWHHNWTYENNITKVNTSISIPYDILCPELKKIKNCKG